MDIFKIPKLQGSSNWDIWSIKIEALLTKEGYFKVIVSDLNDLPDDERDTLQEKAEKATSLIKLALGNRPLLQTRFITNPMLLQNTLKNLYKSKGFSSEFLLSKELINTTLTSCKGNLELYLQTIKRITNSLTAKDIILPNRFIVALLLNNLSKEYEYVTAIITQTIRIEDKKEIDLDQIIN